MTLPEPGGASPVAWRDGWCSLAQPLASPNFGPRPLGMAVDLLVIHSISLPPGEFGNGQVQALFTNQLDWDAHPYFQSIRGLQVSAHFFITRDGLLWQFVSCDQRAWHAGRSCYRGASDCNDNSVGVELEGLEGDLFTQQQYQSLALLSKALLMAYPVSAIAGHEHIAPGRKNDPGPGFDWTAFQALLGGPDAYSPAQVKHLSWPGHLSSSH